MYFFLPLSAWRNIADVGMAADHFRQALLVSKEDERNLKVKLDMAEDELDREGQIINFYKTPNIDWARPFHAKLQGTVRIRMCFIVIASKIQQKWSTTLKTHTHNKSN